MSNASPLIALEQIGQLTLLHGLFDHIVVPPAVTREVSRTLSLPDWIREQSPVQPALAQTARAGLGPGESEAIALALELQARAISLDDYDARVVAGSLGLTVLGTLGAVLRAKEHGIVATVRPHFEALLQAGLWVSPELIARLLSDASEA